VISVLSSMSRLDAAAIGGAIQHLEKGRYREMVRLAQRLGSQGVLHPNVTVDQATDLLWLLTSFDSFDMLYTGRKHPTDRVARILITTAERTLYG
jgi:hypothetical protein